MPKTIWVFREHLVSARAINNLFARFDKHLSKSGYLAKGGQIVDATLVAAPKQRNNDGEKAAIKEGKTAEEIWPDQPAKAAQKDTDARWTVKFSKAKPDADGMVRQRDIVIPAFGYKNHASIEKSRLGLFIRTIGMDRAKVKIGMANFAYNLTRYVWHQGRTAPA